MAIQQIDPRNLVQALHDAVSAGSASALREVLLQVGPDSAARALDELTPSELAAVFAMLGDVQLAEVIENFDARDAARLLLKLSHGQAADVLEEMDPDDAADVVEEFKPDQAEAILVEMEAPEAEDIRELMAYPPHTAAGHMTRELVTISPDLTAEQALVAIRRVAEEAETIYYVYVTDNHERLLGVISLRDLVLTPPNTPISQITRRDLVKVRADADQEVAARLLTDRGFLALPVVDAEDRLLGIITADDVAEVLEEEASEDIARLGGSEPLDEPYLRTTVMGLVRKRVVWLLVLFVASWLTGSVLQHFQDQMNKVVALGFFIPLLIGTGGNVGSQTVTTLVRAMGVGEVHLGDLPRVLGKEVAAASVLGLVMAVGAFVRAITLDVEVNVAAVVALTACFIVVWAASVSAVLPLVLRRCGVDPAVVSAPFITTLVDGTGLFIYFTIARLVLGI